MVHFTSSRGLLDGTTAVTITPVKDCNKPAISEPPNVKLIGLPQVSFENTNIETSLHRAEQNSVLYRYYEIHTVDLLSPSNFSMLLLLIRERDRFKEGKYYFYSIVSFSATTCQSDFKLIKFIHNLNE